ncbi:hypothetical protein CC78DRAFT_583852 [Lojkania enalia]|uniref:Uncharacterized protein n=1 Tax=Lojkania enalia TaxID=147567 RepID=A0A9P4K373_9PLEO|nr:hypothetical protein CC78DRAFT_583852 [Didymosphaeria enalia]
MAGSRAAGGMLHLAHGTPIILNTWNAGRAAVRVRRIQFSSTMALPICPAALLPCCLRAARGLESGTWNRGMTWIAYRPPPAALTSPTPPIFIPPYCYRLLLHDGDGQNDTSPLRLNIRRSHHRPALPELCLPQKSVGPLHSVSSAPTPDTKANTKANPKVEAPS